MQLVHNDDHYDDEYNDEYDDDDHVNYECDDVTDKD